ncbi:SIS domain-containing protein [Leifsonia sp. McL0607]|uniref:SIS domain-containing protein n=1 Tax=Leifsonia sp. McL0607 TaxID=3415672 RepID=UPI003CE9F0F8
MTNPIPGSLPARTAPTPVTGAVLGAYFDDLREVVDRIDVDAFAAAADVIIAAILDERRVFIAGNGGSAATASHMANDWAAGATDAGSYPIIMCLADNVSSVTATANDLDFDDVFGLQVQRLGRAEDVLVLLSVSGNSPNLIRAGNAGKRLGMHVVSLLGNSGAMAGTSTSHASLGSDDYGVVEDLHLALNHAIVRVLRGGVAHRTPVRTAAPAR